MFGVSSLSRAQRLVLGMFVLLLVDVIWVASWEVNQHLSSQMPFGRPYFSTYMKSTMFVLYLGGFLIWRSWWLQCHKKTMIEEKEREMENVIETDNLLSEPVYVPVKVTDDKKYCEPSTSNGSPSRKDSKADRNVRFSNLSEVRHLSEVHAEEAKLARLSYTAFIRAEEARVQAASKLTVKQVSKMSAIFCFVFFFANLSYQEAFKTASKAENTGENLSESRTGVVHVLSSTSGLFTLVLAAIFPSTSGDRLTLTKFVAVALSIGGVVLVSLSDKIFEPKLHLGTLFWALSGAILYAIYLVLLRRRVDNEDKLNIPMFFGFLGLFTVLFLWPGLVILHFTGKETFEWPDPVHWFFLVANGIIGTVLSELLWLWGCFLTSSLAATLALSLTIPMTMLADIAFNNAKYNWMFYAGIAPIFLAFFAVTILSHYETWDPVLLALKKVIQCVCRRRFTALPSRLRDLDREQTENLIGINRDISES